MSVTFDERGLRRPVDTELDELEFELAKLPSSPTTVAVIESIATGAPTAVVDQRAAADKVAALFATVTGPSKVTAPFSSIV